MAVPRVISSLQMLGVVQVSRRWICDQRRMLAGQALHLNMRPLHPRAACRLHAAPGHHTLGGLSQASSMLERARRLLAATATAQRCWPMAVCWCGGGASTAPWAWGTT